MKLFSSGIWRATMHVFANGSCNSKNRKLEHDGSPEKIADKLLGFILTGKIESTDVVSVHVFPKTRPDMREKYVGSPFQVFKGIFGWCLHADHKTDYELLDEMAKLLELAVEKEKGGESNEFFDNNGTVAKGEKS